MSLNRDQLLKEAQTCLGREAPAGDLVECLARRFPDIEVNRQNDDLILKGGQRFLIVRRVAANKFKVSENAAAPTVNLIDFGGGADRDLDQLIDEISTLAD